MNRTSLAQTAIKQPSYPDLLALQGVWTQTAMCIAAADQYTKGKIQREFWTAMPQSRTEGSSSWYYARIAENFVLQPGRSPELKDYFDQCAQFQCSVPVPTGFAHTPQADLLALRDLMASALNEGVIDFMFRPNTAIAAWQERTATEIHDLLRQTEVWRLHQPRTLAQILLGTALQLHLHFNHVHIGCTPTETKVLPEADGFLQEGMAQVHNTLCCLLTRRLAEDLRPHGSDLERQFQDELTSWQRRRIRPRNVPPVKEFRDLQGLLRQLNGIRGFAEDWVRDHENDQMLPHLARRLRRFTTDGETRAELPLPWGSTLLIVEDENGPVFYAADGRLHYSTIAAGVHGADQRHTPIEILGAGKYVITIARATSCIVREEDRAIAPSQASCFAPLPENHHPHTAKLILRAHDSLRERLHGWEDRLPHIFDLLPTLEPLIIIEGREDITIVCRTDHAGEVRRVIGEASEGDGSPLLSMRGVDAGGPTRSFTVTLPRIAEEVPANERRPKRYNLTGVDGHAFASALIRCGAHEDHCTGSHRIYKRYEKSASLTNRLLTTTESVDWRIIHHTLRRLGIDPDEFVENLR